MSSVDVRREPHGRMNCTIEPAHSATRPSIVPSVCAHTDAVTAILNFGPLPKARIWPILRPISRHCDSENGRDSEVAHMICSAVWIVEGSTLYVPSMVSVMLLRRGPD